MLVVFGATVITTLIAKKTLGYRGAINALIVMILCCPLYLYVPIVYTDTLVLIVPVLTIYVWLLAKENESKKRKYIYWAILSIVAMTGFAIKPIAVVTYVAIIIETLFCNIKQIKPLLLSILIFLILLFGYNFCEEKLIVKDSPWTYPYTHWLMMGLNKPTSEGGSSIGWGAYSEEDNIYTGQVYGVEERKNANIIKIKERLKNFEIEGYISFLFNKFKYVWNDGTYYVFNKIGWDTLNKETVVYDYVLGEESKTLHNYIKYFHTFMMFVILGNVIIKTKKDETSRIMITSMIGTAIFLLIWEARSRYIFFLVPILCLLTAYGISNFSNWINLNKIKNIKERLK